MAAAAVTAAPLLVAAATTAIRPAAVAAATAATAVSQSPPLAAASPEAASPSLAAKVLSPMTDSSMSGSAYGLHVYFELIDKDDLVLDDDVVNDDADDRAWRYGRVKKLLTLTTTMRRCG